MRYDIVQPKNLNILGINISHNASICLLKNGKITKYLEEEDFNGHKWFFPWYEIEKEEDRKYLCLNEIQDEHIDYVIYSTFDRRGEDMVQEHEIIEPLQKQLKCQSVIMNYENHHLHHAYCGFHFSNFDDAIVIVMDGGGSQIVPTYQEIESIYTMKKQDNFDVNHIHCHYKHCTNRRKGINATYFRFENGTEYKFSSARSCGMMFSKTVQDYNIPFELHAGYLMEISKQGNLEGDRLEDVARRLQEKTKNYTIDLIKKAITYSNTKNIVLSGGYALNTLNNEEYVKAFPDYNFFVDPHPHDGGTAIGAALWLNRKMTTIEVLY